MKEMEKSLLYSRRAATSSPCPGMSYRPSQSGKKKADNREIGKRIGQRVKALRKKYGLTQNQLATMSGVKRPNISRLEAGTHVPGILLIERLAESLQVKISELIVDRDIF